MCVCGGSDNGEMDVLWHTGSCALAQSVGKLLDTTHQGTFQMSTLPNLVVSKEDKSTKRLIQVTQIRLKTYHSENLEIIYMLIHHGVNISTSTIFCRYRASLQTLQQGNDT